MSGTTVVNFRKQKYDVKVCRCRDGSIPDPPRAGCFGNPFTVSQYGREECIEMYRDYFLKRVREDPAFAEAARALKGKRLGCFCKPWSCHGDVIAAWLDEQE